MDAGVDETTEGCHQRVAATGDAAPRDEKPGVVEPSTRTRRSTVRPTPREQ